MSNFTADDVREAIHHYVVWPNFQPGFGEPIAWRPPVKGEYYLSQSKTMVLKAYHDFSSPQLIYNPPTVAYRFVCYDARPQHPSLGDWIFQHNTGFKQVTQFDVFDLKHVIFQREEIKR